MKSDVNNYLVKANFKKENIFKIEKEIKKYNIEKINSSELLGDIVIASYFVGEKEAIIKFKKSFITNVYIEWSKEKKAWKNFFYKRSNIFLRELENFNINFREDSPFLNDYEINFINKIINHGFPKEINSIKIKKQIQNDFFLLITS